MKNKMKNKMNKKAEMNWGIIILMIIVYLVISFLVMVSHFDRGYSDYQGWMTLFKPGVFILTKIGLGI